MPLGVDPELLLFVGIVGGIGATANYIAFRYAGVLGPEITSADLLPAPPPYPPIPRFLITRPDLAQKLLPGRR